MKYELLSKSGINPLRLWLYFVRTHLKRFGAYSKASFQNYYTVFYLGVTATKLLFYSTLKSLFAPLVVSQLTILFL